MSASRMLASRVYFGSKCKTKGFVRDFEQMSAKFPPARLIRLMLVLKFRIKNILLLFYIIKFLF
jgi:hypothetical protein